VADRKKKKKKEAAKAKRRAQKRQAEGHSSLTSGLGPDVVLISAPPGEVKMSEVLLELIDPLLEAAPTLEGMRKVVVVGLVAWNTALRPRDEWDESLKPLLATIPEDLHADFLVTVASLIRRKLELFPDIDRYILNYDLTMTPTGPHLNVISTMPGVG
jgi:hypothetical protein